MNDLQPLARTQAVIGDVLGKPAADIAADATMLQLGCDSLDVVEIAIELEAHFAVRLSDDDSDQLEMEHTTAHIAGIMKRLLADKAGTTTL